MRKAKRDKSMCKVTSRLSCQTIWPALAAFAFLAAARPARSQSTADAAHIRAVALFSKALAVSGLRAPGSPPFEMRGTITVKQRFGKPEIGSYLLEWASPEKWREKIRFANYTRIRVGGKNQYSQSRTTSYELGPLLQLSQGLEFLKTLHAWSSSAAIANYVSVTLHQKKARGVQLDCLTLISKEQNRNRPGFCFDTAMGTLVSDSSGSTEFSSFISFGGKYFPGKIRTAGKAPSAAPVTLQVNSISPLGNTKSADFEPAPDSTVWPSCDAPDALSVLKSGAARPVYPMRERTARIEGTVFLYAVIGSDGQVTNLRVLTAPGGSALANSALTAVKQWKYAPETCGGTPVPIETLIQITYGVGP